MTNKNTIQVFENREFFANEMLDKYCATAPSNIISDIGAGFGFMKTKIQSVGGQWQPFDYVKKNRRIYNVGLKSSCTYNI